MNNYVITNDKLVQNTEKVIYQIQSNSKNNPYTEFCLTDDNLYIYERLNSNAYNTHVIKKSQITAISVNTQKQTKDITPYLFIGIVVSLIGLITPIITSIYSLFFILAIGIVSLIVGFIIGRPKYNTAITIYTPSPLNIATYNITPEVLSKLKTELLKTDNPT